jgi:hypothetical protein
MKRRICLVAVAVGVAAATLVLPANQASATVAKGSTAAHHAHPGPVRQLAAAARATDRFHRLAVAEKAGYGLFTDAAGISCIDMPPEGAMGTHYVRGDIVGDGALNVRTPEALVYEKRHGKMQLVALEYVVLKADWDVKHKHPPKLFGQKFQLTPEGNRYGLPDFYSLHVWLWKANPDGLFNMWNPRVHCHCGGAMV